MEDPANYIEMSSEHEESVDRKDLAGEKDNPNEYAATLSQQNDPEVAEVEVVSVYS